MAVAMLPNMHRTIVIAASFLTLIACGAPSSEEASSRDDDATSERSTTEPSASVADAPRACGSTTPIDATAFPYTKGRARSPGACTKAEIDTLVAYERTHGQDELRADEWRATVSSRCGTCAFSEEGQTPAAPIIIRGEEFVRANVPGCYEVVSGNVECGLRLSQYQQCVDRACAPCTSADGAEDQECRRTRSVQEACGAAAKARDEACAAKNPAMRCTYFPPAFLNTVTEVCGGAP